MARNKLIESDLVLFFTGIKHLPILKDSEQRKLVKIIQENTDYIHGTGNPGSKIKNPIFRKPIAYRAINEITNRNIRFLVSRAIIYTKNGELLDLINEGYFGLVKAADYFDLNRDKIKFVTYAAIAIDSYIKNYKTMMKKRERLNRLPILSLDYCGSSDKSLTDTLADKGEATPNKRIIEEFGYTRDEVRRFVESIKNTRLRAVISHRFFNGLSLKQTAELFGCSKERVRQLQIQAIKKLRKIIQCSEKRRTVEVY